MDDLALVRGRVFCVSDPRGDVDTATHPDHGLYAHDTRHLATWRLTVDGHTLTSLSASTGASWARLLLTPPAGRHHGPPCTVRRERHVDPAGLVEELTLTSHRRETTTLAVHLAVGADHADLFEVRAMAPTRTRDVTRAPAPDGVTLAYGGGTGENGKPFAATTTVTTTAPPEADATGLGWTVTLPPGGTWTTRVTVRTAATGTTSGAAARGATADGGPGHARTPAATPCADARAAEDDEVAAFLAHVPRLDTDRADLTRTWDRSLRDLAALRVPPPGRPDLAVPAAGLPWFCTLFGRDSLLTAWYALPYLPALARDTLQALAALQGTTTDPAREEEPGKILHEVRDGEVAARDTLPYARYYGTVDATPLFLVLLDAYHRVTGDDALVHTLRGPALASLDWVRRHDDATGWLTYAPGDDRGLTHQCWKDSPTSIVHPDGTHATGPVAVAEAQGYAYDAYVRTARLARDVWDDPALAADSETRAQRLRTRFRAHFWCEDLGFPALALDGDGRPVATLASNAGHLLASGILDPADAGAVAARLTEPAFFSGWGLRTLAATETAYHPLEYHNGSVWPHDTALAVAGLTRYGHHDAAALLAHGLLDAAAHLDHRLPEVFAGYARADTGVPAGYPTACSPQAWAAATPLLLVTCLTGGDATLSGPTPAATHDAPPGAAARLPDGATLRLGG